MTYTSIEQVSQLLELGIPPETADMYYKYNDFEDTWAPYIMPDYMDKELILEMLQLKRYKPCWSAENLYNLIPKSNSGVGKEIYPMIIKDSLFDRGYKITSIPYDTTYHESLVDAAIEMLNCTSNQKKNKK